VLAVSTIDPRKNLERLLSAWRLVSKRHKEISLAVVGATSSLFSRVQLEQAPENVAFLGYVNDDDLRSLYTHCELFVYPSVYEGFGLPPLEAMAAGSPVVASDIPAHVETLAGAAQLVDPYDVSSIAEGILSVLDDAELQSKLATAGVKRSACYTWQRTADSLMALFRQILDEITTSRAHGARSEQD
jgi:glycosyltransferase involved in cell wall biosynthesis